MKYLLILFFIFYEFASVQGQQMPQQIPNHLIVFLPNGSNDSTQFMEVLTSYKKCTYELRNLGSPRDYLIIVKKGSTKGLKGYLDRNKIRTDYDYLLPNEGQGAYIPYDPYVENYYSDWPGFAFTNVESVDLDSLRAFTLPNFRNGEDDSSEAVKLVFTELPEPIYYGNELPLLDSVNSFNLYLNNSNFSTPLGAHGSVVVAGALAMENSQNILGTGIVGRTVIRNYNSGTGNVTSLFIAFKNWCINYLNSNPTKGLVTSHSHACGSYSLINIPTNYNGPAIKIADSILSSLNRVIICHSSGNANSDVPEEPESTNWDNYLSVSSSDGSGNKASFSDWGPWVDVYFQGESVNGLALGGGGVTTGNNGTSFSAPRVAGLVNLIWNYVGGPSKIGAAELCNKFRNNPRSYQVLQPDSTLRPIPHAFDILMRFVNTMEEDHPADFDAVTEPIIDLKQWTNTVTFPQLTGLGPNQVRYYIKVAGVWQPLSNGILYTNNYGNGAHEFKIEWENNGVADTISWLPQGTVGTWTTTTIYRYKNIINSSNIQPPALPILSYLNISNLNPICGNGTQQTGKLLNPQFTVQVKHNGIVIPFNSSDSTFNYTPQNGQDTITITYSNAGGISLLDTIYTTLQYIQPVNNPLIALPNVSTLCLGSSMTFTANISGGAGYNTYSWNNSNIWIPNGTYIFTPASTGIYTITLSARYHPSLNECINSNQAYIQTNQVSYIVNVSNSPSLSINYTDSICLGQPAWLNASGASNISWSNSIINGVNFYPTATTTYTVTASNTSGCTITESRTIVVMPNPSIIITTTPNDTVCAGSSIALTATGGTYYSWTGGINNGTPFTPTTNGIYTVTVTGANGCTNTQPQSIAVNPLPSINITATPDDTVCAGTSVALTATGGMFYSWTGGINNGTSFTPTTNGTYTVTVTGANGCTKNQTQNIAVNPLPNINITTTPNDTICAGTSVVLTATGGTSYSWTSGINNGTPFTPTTNGNYTVTVTGAYGCTNTQTQGIIVKPNLAPTISISSNPLQGATNDPILYTATTNLPLPYSIEWYRNNILNYTGTTNNWSSNIISGANSVYAIIRSPNQCLSPDSAKSNQLEVLNITGVSNILPVGFWVYPNPTERNLTIEGLEVGDNFSIYDAIGNVVLSSKADKNILQLDISNLSIGIYHICFSRKSLNWVVKFSKY